MREYFYSHFITVNEKELGNICNKLINILNAGYLTNIVINNDLGNIYVNDGNVKRFISDERINFIKSHNLEKYYLPTIRETKAKALFWKYLEHKIEYLWE